MKKLLLTFCFLYYIGIFSNAQTNTVDLGLPSGTLWADRNIGATKPEDIGIHITWASVNGVSITSRKEIKHNTFQKMYKQTLNGDSWEYYFTKYNTRLNSEDLSKGVVADNKSILEEMDDAASKALGNAWAIPTKEQINELLTNCSFSLSKLNGKRGYIVKGPSGNEIFLPLLENEAKYWSSTLSDHSHYSSPYGNGYAHALELYKHKDLKPRLGKLLRVEGAMVRPVKKAKIINTTKPILSLLNSSTTTDISTFNVNIGIKSSSAIVNTKVYVNKQLSRGVTAIKNDGYDFTINQEVTLKEGANEIRVEVTNAAGTSTETYSITYKKNKVVNRPELTWKSLLTATSKDYALWVGVQSSAAITDTKVYHNGQLSRGVVPVKNDGDDYSIKRNIVLANGENVIRVDVTNEGGTSSITKTISLSPTTPVPNPQPAPSNVVVNSQKRLALVIGNSQYTHATKLPNPANDATDISQKLRSLGFDVIEKHDLTLKTFKAAIREFGSKASMYDASLLYYAGHAIEANGKNYLIPIDAELATQADIEDECVRADYVIDHLEEAKSKMNIIVLDACRNNPITRSWTRSVTGGLSSMNAPSGTFIAFSTAPGRTADDGTGRNSPFTEAFLKNLDLPDIQLEVFFKNVLQDVSKKTSNRQIPWMQSSFIGDFYFNKK